MIIENIIYEDEYVLKNYTVLNENEKQIALDFRNLNREWMINQNIIEIEEHKNWINALSSNRATIYYLVFKHDIPFMSIDYHDINLEKKEAYWGYFLGNKKYKSEVLKIEKIIIDIAFSILSLDKLMCINDIENPVINIHKFFGFKEEGIVKINDRNFLKMYLINEGNSK